MTVFVDTGVFYAHQNEQAKRHDSASAALDAVARGKFGHPYTSDYIVDEVTTLTRKRTDSLSEALTVANRILGRAGFPHLIELLVVDRETFLATLDVFDSYADQELSITDASIIAQVRRHDLDRVLAFDDDFDGLIDRVNPESLVD